MKTFFFAFLFLFSAIGFAQNNYIVKTEDGRRVLLKADYTWEFIDLAKPDEEIVVTNDISTKENISESIESKSCDLAQNFVEPKLNKKVQAQLKKGRATMDHVKKKVAKDYNCEVEDVLLLSFSEQKAKGVYHFCAHGTKVTYKRNGHTIIESGHFF
jgi:hypothetical protein